jgi:hypothetical protein
LIPLPRLEKAGLAVLLAIFTWFTWRGLIMFFSGDDMMNMYSAWNLNPWRLGRSLLEIWLPIYRPLGAAVYRVFFAVFGFHPAPLYTFCWLLLVANVVLAWRFFRTILPAPFEALTALAIVLVHGSFQDLYISAGTVYDRLWFFFTVLGLTIYARMKQEPRWKSLALVCLMCILAMDSKESGIALPLLLAIYECLYGVRNRSRLRRIAPLYCVLALLSAIFVFLRVHRTWELTANTAYAPHASLTLWLTRVSEYFGILAYHHLAFSNLATAAVLLVMAALAGLLRNRAMLFGWLFFVVTITPVALISSRPGYVLYVPDLGLGIWFAAVLWSITPARRMPVVSFAVVAAAALWFHVRNWTPFFDPRYSPELRLTEQFRRDYPRLPPGSKLLFVSDGFPGPAFDLLFNLRMMYRDRTILADRLQAPPDQRPDPKHPRTYDHVFIEESGRYLELDPRDPAESQRLHILRDYSVGREMDMARRDYAAYVISGVMGGDSSDSARWTAPEAKLKFDVYPAPAVFSAKFWVPDFVAKTAARTLHVLVDGKTIADYPLNHDGMNEPSFPVPADAISRRGFTIVEMNVENPYKDADGAAFGVVLLRAGFAYR